MICGHLDIFSERQLCATVERGAAPEGRPVFYIKDKKKHKVVGTVYVLRAPDGGRPET
jgi:hypothetical protein